MVEAPDPKADPWISSPPAETRNAASAGTALPPVHGFVWDDGKVTTTIDHPDAANATFVFGINDRGDTVGFYDDADGNFQGFLRDRRGHFTDIDAPGAELGTQVTGINERGEIVGTVSCENRIHRTVSAGLHAC